MQKFLKHTAIILVASLVISVVLSSLGMRFLRQSSFYKPSFLVNDVKEANFDYIVLGASTGLTTINTITIDATIGTIGLNLAMDDTAISSQYLMLQHFLSQGKTAKYCILAPSASSFQKIDKRVSDNDYRFLPFVNQEYVSAYYKSFSDRQANILKRSRYIPAIGMSYYNAELFYPSLLSVLKPRKRNRFDSRGNYTYPNINRPDQPITDVSSFPVTIKNEFVEKIKTLCEANNIQLIIYFSPIENKNVIFDNENYMVINHSDLFPNRKYFYDEIHVNTQGRELVSLDLAARLDHIMNQQK